MYLSDDKKINNIYRLDLAADWEEISFTTTLPNPFKYMLLHGFQPKIATDRTSFLA